jgi:hypothetical protein
MKKAISAMFIALVLISSVLAISGVGPIIGTSTQEGGYASEITSEDWARSAVLPYDKLPSDFGLTITSPASSTTVKVGDTLTVKARVTNKQTTIGSMYVQCSILDANQETWMRTESLSRFAIVGATSNCVVNEPYTKTLKVELKGGESYELTFRIPVPNLGSGADPRIFCDTFEQCASDGDPLGSGQDIEKIIITPGTTECVSGQARCVAGTTTQYQSCVDGKWSTTKTCTSPQLCQTNNGACFTPSCNHQCELDTKQCTSSTTYKVCVKNSQGCRIWSGKEETVQTGYNCNNGLVSSLETGCAAGSIRCLSDKTYQECLLAEGMAYAWHPTIKTVQTGKTCSNNKIIDGSQQLTCFRCEGDKVVSVRKASLDLQPQKSLWDWLVSGFSRSELPAVQSTAYNPVCCENELGLFTNPELVCEDGKAIPDLTYYKPEVTSIRVLDCKMNIVEANQADLSCYGYGKNAAGIERKNKIPVYVRIKNNAVLDTKKTPDSVWAKSEGFTNPWYTNMGKRFVSEAKSDAILGGIYDFVSYPPNYQGSERGITEDQAKADYNLQIINSMPELTYAGIEIGLYSKSSFEQYFRASALSRASPLFQQETLMISPACQMSGGVSEDKYGYQSTFRILLIPQINGKCYHGLQWGFGSLDYGFGGSGQYNGACDYEFVVELKVPESGDLIGAEGVSNVDPDGQYFLRASVFDRCWRPEMDTGAMRPTESVSKEYLVQTVATQDVCCKQGTEYSVLTADGCASESGTPVDAVLCSDKPLPYSKMCYKCLDDGYYESEQFTSDRDFICGFGDTLLFPISSEEEAVVECKVDPKTITTCWGCFNDIPDSRTGEGTCGSGIFDQYDYTPETFPGCGGAVDKCYKCLDGKAIDYTFVKQGTKCPEQFPKATEAECSVQPPTSAVIAVTDPDNSDRYCLKKTGQTVSTACLAGSYEKKDLVEVADLDTLEEAEYWDKLKAAFSSENLVLLKDPDVPVCLDSLGDAQCKSGGTCLQAKKGDRGTDENKVYDALLDQVNLDPTQWNGVLQGITSILKVTFGNILVGYDVEEGYVEQFGMCVHKDRDVTSTAKRWFANLFGLDLNDKYFNYYFYGAIAAIIVILFIIITPKSPRTNMNQGGGGF